MKNYFETTIKVERAQFNGVMKKVSEKYVVEAYSFSEAENRILEETTPFSSGELEVAAIKKANFSEVSFSDSESDNYWFKIKVAFITLDEKSGKEKKTKFNMLVQASDADKSISNLQEYMKGTISDWVIEQVSATSIMDVYQS